MIRGRWNEHPLQCKQAVALLRPTSIRSLLLGFIFITQENARTNITKTVTRPPLKTSSALLPPFNMNSSRSRAAPPLAAAAFSLPLLLLLLPNTVNSAGVFTIINHCKTVIWPAAIPGDTFGGGGFALRPGQSAVFKAPSGGWSGRIWGRTGCSFDASGNGSCATGSCGTNLKCGGSGATPVSLAEFTIAADKDFYDVSLVDGFNLPLTVRPVNARGGNCSAAGCDGDLRETCPPELAVKDGGRTTVACRSACDVFDTDQYCCRGKFGSQPTCPPTPYSKRFKDACPTAYSYAYDDASSLFTCSGADYIITFCASRKQQACSYHNNRLVCSDAASSRSKLLLLLLLLLPLVFSALQ